MLQSPTLLSRVLEAAPKPKTTSGVSWLSYKTVLSFVSTKVGKKTGFVDFVDRPVRAAQTSQEARLDIGLQPRSAGDADPPAFSCGGPSQAAHMSTQDDLEKDLEHLMENLSDDEPHGLKNVDSCPVRRSTP